MPEDYDEDDWDEPFGDDADTGAGYDDLDDWYDPDYDDREPDPEDWEIAKAYQEEWEHREQCHGGGECTCKPPLRSRIRWRLADLGRRVRSRMHRDHYYGQPPF